ncbi:unnamed protein product, partial [Ectocarpus sp. 6 AP-2014]
IWRVESQPPVTTLYEAFPSCSSRIYKTRTAYRHLYASDPRHARPPQDNPRIRPLPYATTFDTTHWWPSRFNTPSPHQPAQSPQPPHSPDNPPHNHPPRSR